MRDIRKALLDFDFQTLFVEHLGWDSARSVIVLDVDGHPVQAMAIAQKRGLSAFVIRSSASFPGSAERVRIQRALAKKQPEHIAVFCDSRQSRQVWRLARLAENKQKFGAEISYVAGRPIEHLARKVKNLTVDFAEEDKLTLSDVHAKAASALLADKVTKKFFDQFKVLREGDKKKGVPGFVDFLQWVDDEAKREWYCSVLLNRLMFIYFLGGKGFLPGDTKFLAYNLAENAKKNGKDTFYTHFLLPLSFFGLGERQGKRGRFEETFKDVLYLDGGLFTVHQVERELGLNKEAVEKGVFPAGAKIPDIEFKRWFDYFDKWRWTLDEDKVENDGYISPHILGYIFEKYINQKQMGAYYTKEDITGYICRNTIIPRLFDMLAETGEKGKKSVRPLPVGPHPNLLNDGRGISDGEGIDRYIYASVKQEAKLPTETDYEQEQRRKRYEGILGDFDAEQIQGIDDFITYNLDIEKLALDFVSNIQDPEVLHAFYFKGLQQITVLDPTCGSGAFLFEALIIMYPLYNACLSRMRYLVGKATGDEPDVVNWGGRLHFDDLDVDGSTLVDLVQGGGSGSKILDDLRAEVERINDHPSAEYFIKKSIIVNNLFGVDIMEEAVEICKLRLFLTLIATVERDDSKDNYGVEPLPDIDFNILAGNSLVGYTSISDIDRLWHEVELGSSTLAFEKDHSKLKSLVDEYGRLLKAWRLQQLGEWKGAPITKEQVLRAVEQVRPELNKDIWNLYRDAGQASTIEKGKRRPMTQAEFVYCHEPFHWMLEFPSIEANGGFDVVTGNPPYVEVPSASVNYGIIGYNTITCGDLYALVLERSHRLLAGSKSRLGFVVPISLPSTDGFKELRETIRRHSETSWMSHYAERPAKLFNGVEKRLTIYVSSQGSAANEFTSHYHRWLEEERSLLMERIAFCQLSSADYLVGSSIPKAASSRDLAILRKLSRQGTPLGSQLSSNGEHLIYYTRKLRYFVQFFDFVPRIEEASGASRTPSELKILSFDSEAERDVALALLNSSTFFWFFCLFSDVRNVNRREIVAFPVDLKSIASMDSSIFRTLSHELMESYKDNSIMANALYKGIGTLKIQSFRPRASKGVMDEIDRALAPHFGFTHEDLQSILNFDLKYRMGLNNEEEGD